MPGERSTPTSQSTYGRKAAPASPVPQPRSSIGAEAHRLARAADCTASSSSSRPAIGEPLAQGLVEFAPRADRTGGARRLRSCPASPRRRRAARAAAARRGSPPGRPSLARANAAMAPARSPSASRIAPSANQAVAKCRRELQRLLEDIGGAGEIAALRVVDRPLVAAVGDQVAGGNEKRRCRHGATRMPI